jgi:hypothetical protein
VARHRQACLTPQGRVAAKVESNNRERARERKKLGTCAKCKLEPKNGTCPWTRKAMHG